MWLSQSARFGPKKRQKKRNLEKRIEKMGKTPKQYKRRSGATTPERIDVDDELERQLARNTRDQSTEREKTRLDQRREERRTERTKGKRLLFSLFFTQIIFNFRPIDI